MLHSGGSGNQDYCLRVQNSCDLMLIKDVIVVGLEIVRADILIEDGKIVKIGKISGKADIDGRGKIAIPGLVNCHTHVAMTLMRSYGEGLPLHQWLEKKIWPTEQHQEYEDINVASKLAFCEMLKGGTTAFAEMCLHDIKPVFDAANELHIKGIISRGVMDFFDPSKTKSALRDLKKTFEYSSQLVSPSAAVHAPYTCSKDLIFEAKKLAEDSKFQIHVSETRKEIYDIKERYGCFPFEFLEPVMDSNSLFVHAGWVTKREISLAGRKQLNIVHCPISNLKLATGGICQVTEFSKAGANVCLGTDSVASNNALDMFQEMKVSALLQKHHYWDANIQSAKQIFLQATLNGAKAIGINSGVLSEGMDADIVLLNKTSNLTPLNDIYSHLVYSAGKHNVSEVIVDGRLVVSNGAVLTVDEAELIEEAESQAELLFSRK